MKAGLAVVGASPAGLAAALAAAQGGADVVLLESRPTLGVPESLARVAFDHLMPAQIEVPEGCIQQRVEGLDVVSPAGHRLQVPARAGILDRTRFDQHLARQAEDAGARILTGVGPLRLRGRTLHAGADDGFSCDASVLLFADGAASLARQVMRPIREPDRILWGAAHRLQAARTPDRITLRLGSHAPGGRTQWNPGPDGWTHWSFAGRDASAAIAHARAALRVEARAHGADADDAVLLGAAPDPVYALPGDLVTDGVMVAGGAAAQGGLEVGLASGLLAGTVAAAALATGRRDVAALRPYEQQWRARYGSGYERLRQATDLVALASDAELDTLVAAWADADVPSELYGRSSPRWRQDLAAIGFGLRHPRGLLALVRLLARQRTASSRAMKTGRRSGEVG